MGNSDNSGAAPASRPIYADPNADRMYVIDPETGEPTPIIDPATGKPMRKRPLLTDTETGYVCAIDMHTGKASPLVDPLSGGPLTSAASTSEAEPASQSTLPAVVFDEQALSEADSASGDDAAPDDDAPGDAEDGSADVAAEVDFSDGDPHAVSGLKWEDLLSEETVEVVPSYVPPVTLPTHDLKPKQADMFGARASGDVRNVATPAEIAQMQAEIDRLTAQVEAQSRRFALIAAIVAAALVALAIVAGVFLS